MARRRGSKKSPPLSSDRWKTYAAGLSCPDGMVSYEFQSSKGTRIDLAPACQVTGRERARGWYGIVSDRGFHRTFVVRGGAGGSTEPSGGTRFRHPSHAKAAAEAYVNRGDPFIGPMSLDGKRKRRRRR